MNLSLALTIELLQDEVNSRFRGDPERSVEDLEDMVDALDRVHGRIEARLRTFRYAPSAVSHLADYLSERVAELERRDNTCQTK